jgi:hypothetical protein
MARFSEQMTIRLSPGDKRTFNAAAKRVGMSRMAWVRWALVEAAVATRPEPAKAPRVRGKMPPPRLVLPK